MDVAPKQKLTLRDKIAHHLCMIGSTCGESDTARAFADRDLKSIGENWNDVGNAYKHYPEYKELKELIAQRGNLYTETEMQEYAQAMRKECIEAGIRIGEARASNGNGNGHGYTLPREAVMADFCHAQLYRLETKHHEFARRMYARQGNRISRKELGYLMSIYVQAGGKI